MYVNIKYDLNLTFDVSIDNKCNLTLNLSVVR